MKELLDYLNERHGNDAAHKDAAVAMLEVLYFRHVRELFQPLSKSPEFKVAQDLVYLRSCCSLTNMALDLSKIKTELIKGLVRESDIQIPLRLGDKSVISSHIIDQYDYVVTAVFLADMALQIRRSESLRWVVVSTTALLAALGGLSWLFTHLSGG